MYDLIIIGAGPAGLSAAVYAIRKKLNIIVLTENGSEQVTEAHQIDNYLGLPSTPGVDLIEKFRDHAKKLSVEVKENSSVKIISAENGVFVVNTQRDSYQAKALIVASGKRYRQLTIPGAKEFEGKGITYCATCDAPIFKDKVVAVIGGGDAGQDAAQELTKYAKKVYLLNKYEELRGQNIQTQDALKNNDKVEIINNALPLKIKGEKFVKSLVYQRADNKKNEIALDGIFVEIGSVPTSEFLNNVVKLNEKNEIIIDHKTNATSEPGIFAAGDVTDTNYKQMIIAAGEGGKAALSAYEYLKNK